MSATKHTAEPWHETNSVLGDFIEGTPLMVGSVPTPRTVARVDYSSPARSAADRARIVACVNACAGIEDPVAVLAEAREAFEELIRLSDSPNNVIECRAAKALRALGGQP